MSLGLLGDYSSGSEISDSDGEYEQDSSGKNDNQTESNNTSSKTEPLIIMGTCSGTNEGESTSAGKEVKGDPLSYIQKDVSSSDNDSSSDKDMPSGDDDDTADPLYTSSALPDLDQLTSPTNQLTAATSFTSVFSNPYKEAEEAKLAMLKRHVSEFAPDKKPAQQGKARRHKFRGGKRTEAPKHRSGHTLGGSSSTESQRLFNDDDSCIVMGAQVARHCGGRGGVKRKQRSGVTSTLVPPKKYLKNYGKAQAEERPWTVRQN